MTKIKRVMFRKWLMRTSIIAAFAIVLTSYTYSIFAVKPAGKVDCRHHPLYCHILTLQPNVDKKWAKHFADRLYYHSKQYKMDPWLSLAIAMQESSLKNTHRSHPTIVFKEHCHKGKCLKTYDVVTGYSDLSVFQFHVNTVIAQGLDPLRLNSDLDYVIASHYKLLKLKQKRCKHLKNEAWSCYHSRTERFRKHYTKAVKRHYKGKKKITN